MAEPRFKLDFFILGSLNHYGGLVGEPLALSLKWSSWHFLIQHGVSESIFRNSPCFQVGREPVHSLGSPPSDTSPPRQMATPKPLLSRKSVATTVGHKEINPLA